MRYIPKLSGMIKIFPLKYEKRKLGLNLQFKIKIKERHQDFSHLSPSSTVLGMCVCKHSPRMEELDQGFRENFEQVYATSR